MNLILIFGDTGSGKSHFAKEYIKGSPCLVFDYQNEYTWLEKDINQEQCRFFGTPQEFIELIKMRQNTIVVWEEATGFLRGKINDDLVREVLSKRHSNNTFVFIFHAIHRAPVQLLEFADYIVLFKTDDLYENVKKKAPHLLKQYIDLQQKAKKGLKYQKHIIKRG